MVSPTLIPPIIAQPTNLLPLNNWEGQYNGLLFGAGTPYEISTIDGIDSPDIRDDSVDWMASHGSFTNAQFYAARVVTITADVVGDVDSGEFAANVLALRAAFLAQQQPLPLRLLIPGWGTRVVFAVPLKFALPTDTSYAIGRGQWAAQLKAGDPRIYDDNLQVLSTPAPVMYGLSFGGVGSGLSFGGVGGGLSFGGGILAIMEATNSGTVDTPIVISFQGPGITPQLVNQSLGKTLRFNLTLASTDTLVIDTLARTVVLNGYSSEYNAFDPTSSWWDLGVGTNQLQFLIDSPGGGTSCSVAFRNAWM